MHFSWEAEDELVGDAIWSSRFIGGKLADAVSKSGRGGKVSVGRSCVLDGVSWGFQVVFVNLVDPWGGVVCSVNLSEMGCVCGDMSVSMFLVMMSRRPWVLVLSVCVFVSSKAVGVCLWSSGEKMYLCVCLAWVLRRRRNFLIDEVIRSSLSAACMVHCPAVLF